MSRDPLVLSGLAMASSGRAAGRFTGAASRPGVAADLDVPPPAEADGAEAEANGHQDRPTQLAATTAAALLDGGAIDGCPPGRRGLVLGSGLAGIDQSMTVTSTSLTRRRPYNVSPALVATCVMNYAAGQTAIRHDLQGPNVTATAGRVTGLAVLGYARRLLGRGRADLVLAGAFEDLNERRAALERLSAWSDGSPSEGSCAFLVERAAHAHEAGRPVLAELAGQAWGTVTAASERCAVLDRVVRRALAAAGADPEDVAVAAVGPDGEKELAAVLPRAAWEHPEDVVGDTHGAVAAFRVAAAVLAAAPGRYVLVAVTDPDGQVGCVVLRRPA